LATLYLTLNEHEAEECLYLVKPRTFDEVKKLKEVAYLQKNCMPLYKAAKRIVRQVENGKFRIVIGRKMFWIDLASRLFPTTIHSLLGKNKNRIDFI
jgi:short-subunit dehydrogenase